VTDSSSSPTGKRSQENLRCGRLHERVEELDVAADPVDEMRAVVVGDLRLRRPTSSARSVDR